MATFPRFKPFKFTFKNSVTVDAAYAGRLDLIALDQYGDIRYYKPLAAANGIKYPLYLRYGIRRYDDSVQKDLNDLNIVDLTVADIRDSHEPGIMDWNYYGDLTSGYSTEVYEGLVLRIPTNQSANLWLSTYETM